MGKPRKPRAPDRYEGLTAKQWSDVAQTLAGHLVGEAKRSNDRGAYLLALYSVPPWYASENDLARYAAVSRLLRENGTPEPTEEMLEDVRASNSRAKGEG